MAAAGLREVRFRYDFGGNRVMQQQRSDATAPSFCFFGYWPPDAERPVCPRVLSTRL
jgi:hypothetical protein